MMAPGLWIALTIRCIDATHSTKSQPMTSWIRLYPRQLLKDQFWRVKVCRNLMENIKYWLSRAGQWYAKDQSTLSLICMRPFASTTSTASRARSKSLLLKTPKHKPIYTVTACRNSLNKSISTSTTKTRTISNTKLSIFCIHMTGGSSQVLSISLMTLCTWSHVSISLWRRI